MPVRLAARRGQDNFLINGEFSLFSANLRLASERAEDDL